MTDQYSAALGVVMPELSGLGVTATLGDVLSRIGLTQVEMSATPPDWVSEPLPPLLPEVTLEELKELMAVGPDDSGPLSPPTPPDPHDVEPPSPLATGEQKVTLHLKALSEILIDLPGLDGVSLVLNPGAFKATLTFAGEQSSVGFTVGLGIRFKPTLLRPVKKKTADDGRVTFEPDASRPFVQLQVASVSVEMDLAGEIKVTGGIGVQLKDPVLVGDTGMVIETADVVLNLTGDGRRPAGTPEGWKGLLINRASLRFPDLFSGPITAEGFGIGSGGVSGTIGAGPFRISYEPKKDPHFTGDLVGKVFGIEGGLQEVSLTFQQNIPVGGRIRAQLILPFFETEKPLELDISLASGGKFMVALSSPNGLLDLTRPDLLRVQVQSVGFAVESGLFTLKLSGELTPLVAGYTWPSFRVKELSVSSDGDVRLDGGWLNLPDKYALDFHGFKFEISKLGFGRTEDGGKWFGFSGGLRLIDSIPAGASVDGLRFTWYDQPKDASQQGVQVAFNGIGVEFEVPEVLRFSGKVSYRKEPAGAVTRHLFRGSIQLDLVCIGLEVDAQLVVGVADDGTFFFAIFIGAELPAGVPLGPTPLALYGLAGLFAMHMEPAKGADEPWYSALGEKPGWYQKPKKGVNDLEKWGERQGSFALGAGITIGTVYDSGYTFSGKMLLVLIFPGPVILLEGLVNLFKERKKLNEEPLFRALAVLDFREGSFLFGVEADFRYAGGGELVKLSGASEIYFSSARPDDWHVWIGKNEPRDKRIQAKIFQLFGASFYLMVDSRQFAMGSWIGYDNHWSFGPVSITIEAWLEWNVRINWNPAQLHGDVWLHGKLGVALGPFKLALSGDARLDADVFRPFHILGTVDVQVDLPWPLPDFGFGFQVEWGPDPVPPPLPKPLKAVTLEHPRSSATWPLPVGTLLRPAYEVMKDGAVAHETAGFLDTTDRDKLLSRAKAVVDAGPPLDVTIPVVPLDSRPRLVFNRPVHDAATPRPVGVVVQNPMPEWETIGDPEKRQGPADVKYSLTAVAFHRWNEKTSKWEPRTGEIFGAWTALPQVPEPTPPRAAQVTLSLYELNPFRFGGATSQIWGTWFYDDLCPNYPCPPPPHEDVRVCCDFERERPGAVRSPWSFVAKPELRLYWSGADAAVAPRATLPPLSRALTFTHGREVEVTLHLPEPANRVELRLDAAGAPSAVGYGDGGRPAYAHAPHGPDGIAVDAGAERMTHVVVRFPAGETPDHVAVPATLSSLGQVCYVVRRSLELEDPSGELERHLRQQVRLWQQKGEVFEPWTTYRMTVETRVEAQGKESIADFQRDLTVREYAYFRTEGPPGLATLTPPANLRGEGGDNHELPSAAAFTSSQGGLGDLGKYVRQTVPPTVPAAGAKPVLPRPVYRGYDVGVLYDVSYVDLMYRVARRDLGLYLFDPLEQPLRDARGRLVSPVNRWGTSEVIHLSDADSFWMKRKNEACAPLDKFTIRRNVVQTAPGLRLDADTLYEARIVPFLLHDDFERLEGGVLKGPTGALGGWTLRHEAPVIIDEMVTNSLWKVEARTEGGVTSYSLRHNSRYSGGDEKEPLGALAWFDAERPADWSDYRLSAHLRTGDYAPDGRTHGGIGLAFRFAYAEDGKHSYYLFLMHNVPGAEFSRLYGVTRGAFTELARSDAAYTSHYDHRVGIEAVGDSIRVYRGDEELFSVRDPAPGTLGTGTVGLFAWRNAEARFADVRVEDLRKTAPALYRFKFVSSRYVNFFHHLHGFNDELWRLPPLAAAPAELGEAVDPAAAVAVPESLRYEALADQLLGPSAAQNPAEVELMLLELTAGASTRKLGFLLRSPEPLEWARVSLELQRSGAYTNPPVVPGAVKLTGAAWAASGGALNDEAVFLLVREDAELAGAAVEYRAYRPGMDPPFEERWHPYYRFGDTGRLPAGTRIAIHAGKEREFPVPSGGDRRFFLNQEPTGTVRLPADGFELRIAGGHSRSVLPRSTYAGVPVKLLRKADGTGCFIVPKVGDVFEPGAYELRLTYRRDNTLADPESLVLAEAGDQSDERVTLSFLVST